MPGEDDDEADAEEDDDPGDNDGGDEDEGSGDSRFQIGKILMSFKDVIVPQSLLSNIDVHCALCAGRRKNLGTYSSQYWRKGVYDKGIIEKKAWIYHFS